MYLGFIIYLHSHSHTVGTCFYSLALPAVILPQSCVSGRHFKLSIVDREMHSARKKWLGNMQISEVHNDKKITPEGNNRSTVSIYLSGWLAIFTTLYVFTVKHCKTSSQSSLSYIHTMKALGICTASL